MRTIIFIVIGVALGFSMASIGMAKSLQAKIKSAKEKKQANFDLNKIVSMDEPNNETE